MSVETVVMTIGVCCGLNSSVREVCYVRRSRVLICFWTLVIIFTISTIIIIGIIRWTAVSIDLRKSSAVKGIGSICIRMVGPRGVNRVVTVVVVFGVCCGLNPSVRKVYCVRRSRVLICFWILEIIFTISTILIIGIVRRTAVAIGLWKWWSCSRVVESFGSICIICPYVGNWWRSNS